jgi:hypothetical protein
MRSLQNEVTVMVDKVTLAAREVTPKKEHHAFAII